MGEQKFKISISVDGTTLLTIRKGVREGRFRNRSHAFEYAIQKVLEGGE